MADDGNDPIPSKLPTPTDSAPSGPGDNSPIPAEPTSPTQTGIPGEPLRVVQGGRGIPGESTRSVSQGAVPGERTVDLPLSQD